MTRPKPLKPTHTCTDACRHGGQYIVAQAPKASVVRPRPKPQVESSYE